MKSFVALALVASAFAAPQAAGSGCSDTRSGSFNLQITNVTSYKRSLERRQLAGKLTVTLSGGVLKDQAGRTGSIVANHQFQFDNPVQEDAIATSGFGICSNNTLTHAGSAIWYQCLSGTFYNLYDATLGEHCNQIYISAVGASTAPVTQQPDGQPGASTQVPVTQISDGQPQAPTSKPVVSQISDGQPQAPTGPVISQISDGQPQAPTGPVITQISDGQPQAPTSQPGGPIISQISDGQPQAPTSVVTPTAPVVTQISDGQPQAPTGPVITQISDGQPQAPTGPVVTQISDGQPQAPTGPVITQISDGQPQAPTGPVVTQISDGQPQAPTGPVVTQISDGQPQVPVPTSTATRSGNLTITPNATAPVQFPGTASSNLVGAGAFVAALFAMITML